MRQKATAKRAPANSPGLAVVSSAAAGPATVSSLGQQLREVLPRRRLHSVSLCDHEANVLWLSEGALGPDEHGVVVEAIEVFGADTSMPCHEANLEDGRHALFLPVRAPTGKLVGIAMILADCKSVGDDTQERMTGAPVRAIMQRLAVLLKPGDTPKPGDPHAGPAGAAKPLPEPAAESAAASAPEPAAPGATAPAAPSMPAPNSISSTAPEVISPAQVNDILEFELAPQDIPPPPPTPGLNGSVAPAEMATSWEMVSLEFIPDVPSAVPPAPVAAHAPALPTVQPEAAPSAAPAAAAVPVSNANLILETLPFAKLRAGGQTRRFQILARTSPRDAQRDPAALDWLILQRLLGWLAAHRAVWNSQPTSFTVNLSIATLEDERFAQKIAAALNAHGIAAETLGFEIAEALCAQRRAQIERFITQCEKLGAWVAIDDFSFDSQVLPLLRSKAVRLVKIDPKLSSSALKDKLSQALVVATVQAAKVMGIHCAAKRVDSQAALQWLTAIGCDFAQGAALSPSLPLEALASPLDPMGLGALVRPV